MELRVKFVGGPLDGEVGLVERLDDVKVFFPPRDRQVLMYRRDELTYRYDLELSQKATKQYDATIQFFDTKKPTVNKFVERTPADDEPEEKFSDTPIEDSDEE